METAGFVKEILTPNKERGERTMEKEREVIICTVCQKPIEGADLKSTRQKTHPGECREIHYREYRRQVKRRTRYGASEPTEEEYRSWGREKPKTKRVRCLGHGPEHYFDSPDPANIRLCDNCRNVNKKRFGSDFTRGGHAGWHVQARGA